MTEEIPLEAWLQVGVKYLSRVFGARLSGSGKLRARITTAMDWKDVSAHRHQAHTLVYQSKRFFWVPQTGDARRV
jgi:hypothetical protein